eukprot:73020_1
MKESVKRISLKRLASMGPKRTPEIPEDERRRRFSLQSFKQIGDVLQPIRLEFRDIHFVLKKTTPNKHVLRSVSGFAEPGQFLAVLGGSGAGKSSLLSVLAGRLRSKGNKTSVTGGVLLNGQSVDARTFQKMTAYIMQDDSLFETLTPRETMQFSARLRLSSDLSEKERDQRVSKIIKALDLEKCQDSMTGGNYIRGISGGERKRLSIGVDLITDPGLLFVDEPTTGLDSYTALNTVDLLAELARSGRTVISTIHQPSSEMFERFDQLCLISSGHIVYLGPCSESVDYFAKLGFVCPKYSNPADYFMGILHVESEEDEKRISLLAEIHERKMAIFFEERLQSPALALPDTTDNKRPSTFTEMTILGQRSLKNFTRQPQLFQAKLFLAVFDTFLFSVLFYNRGDKPSSLKDIEGVMYFLMVSAAFRAGMGACYMFPDEKKMFFRERANNMYSTSAYLFAKIMSELPFPIVGITIELAVCYPLIGLKWGFVPWIKFLICILFADYSAYAVGLYLGSLVNTREIAAAICSVGTVPPMLLGGFFLKVAGMNRIVYVLSYLSYYRFLFQNMMYNQFTGFEVDTSDCPKSICTTGFGSGEEYLAYTGLLPEGDHFLLNLLFTSFLFFAFVLATLVSLTIATRRRTVHGTLSEKGRFSQSKIVKVPSNSDIEAMG